MNIQCSCQQPSAAAPQTVPLFLIDSCMNIQCSSQRASAAAPQTVPLFLIDSCMNIQCSSQQPSAAAPQTVPLFLIDSQNFLWRLRRKMLKIVSGAFGAKISKFSLAPSAQNIQIFFRCLQRKIFKIVSALCAKRKCHFFKGSGFPKQGNSAKGFYRNVLSRFR